MIEKVITLDNISLVDFLGAENVNIKEVSAAYPKCKVVSRGNEIRIQGSSTDILKINNTLNDLLEHYHKYGKITLENVQSYISREANGSSSPYTPGDDVIIYGTKGLAIKPRTANQEALVKAIYNNDLVFSIGPAGTGKTFLAVAMAVRALKNKQVKKIIITRPAVEAGENLGFLPGDMKEKIDPYLRPIYDALNELIPSEKLKYYIENSTIEIAPLAYMRGRTLNNAFVLLDEAQNTTHIQMKMFLTRMGPNSQMVVNGDMSQIDLPKKVKSGLVEAVQVLKKVDGIGLVRLDAQDVVRHRLVKKIIDSYDRFEAGEREAR